MRFRALIEQSPWVRGACLVLLVVFLLVCGVHVAGIHHDSDSDGLGLGDRLATILLIAVLGFGLITLARKGSLGSSKSWTNSRQTFVAGAVDPSHFRTVVPLRC